MILPHYLPHKHKNKRKVTEDDNRMLKSLFNKMRKFPKDLIAEIKTKFPSLQRKPKTAEQRKEQDKEGHSRKRSAESEIERERRLTQDKECHSQKRSAESEIDKERRLTQKKDYQSQKRSGESEKDKEMRLTKDKEYQS